MGRGTGSWVLAGIHAFWSCGPAVLVQSARVFTQLLAVNQQGPKGPLFWSSGPAGRVQSASCFGQLQSVVRALTGTSSTPVRGTRIGRGAVHYTHNIRHTRGVLWCRSCGFFSIMRCDKLAKKCQCMGLIRQPTPAGHELIRRMRIGIPPQGLRAWPDLSHCVATWYRTWLGRNPDRSPIWCSGDVCPQDYV